MGVDLAGMEMRFWVFGDVRSSASITASVRTFQGSGNCNMKLGKQLSYNLQKLNASGRTAQARCGPTE